MHGHLNVKFCYQYFGSYNIHQDIKAVLQHGAQLTQWTGRTYLLTPWCRVLLEKLTGLQLVKKFPTFHGTRRFITALTSVRHLSLFWASPIQSIYPHPTSWRSILILSTHLRLGLPSGFLPSGFPTKTLYTPLSSPIRATCPAHRTRRTTGEILWLVLNQGGATHFFLYSSSFCCLAVRGKREQGILHCGLSQAHKIQR